MTITAQMVRELRERTGAGMMDCKKALGATDGDFESAVDHLRKTGMRSAEKMAGRSTGEGRVHSVVSDTGHLGSIVAVACETDFVARTPDFEGFLDSLCAHVAAENPSDADEALGQNWQGGDETMGDAVKRTIGKLGENIIVTHVRRMENAAGLIASYMHHNQKLGVMVSVTTEVERETAEAILRTLCMHIAASRPAVLDRADMDEDVVEREKNIYRVEVEGKPAEIQEKILLGKMRRYYSECVLREQAWVMDDSMNVQQALEAELGSDCTIEAFVRFEIGD